MKMTNQALIEDLIGRTKETLNAVEHYKHLSLAQLNWKANAESWSVLECIEHLNRYGDFYLPEITTRIDKTKEDNKAIFKSGWLGNYFAKSLLPKENLNKMNTFKEMNPVGSQLDKSTLEKFTNQLKTMLDLLNRARTINLTKTKTAISISKWIKLRLGDTFRVVIYHNQRHIVQADKALKAQKVEVAELLK